MISRSNDRWIEDLRPGSPTQAEALEDLHKIILDSLPYALSPWLQPADPRFYPLAEEVTQETLIRVLDRLHTFEGRSRFTTWAQKIAVRLALTELRRKRWENVSLEELVEKGIPFPVRLSAAADDAPESIVESKHVLERLRHILAEELSEKQRQAIVAVILNGMPLEEAARRMDTNRNALYKLLHDARLHLKHSLAQDGVSPQDVLALFEKG